MSERFEIFYTPEARDDLRNIRQYIARDLSAPLTAQNQIGRIVEEIDELMILPERFAVLNDQTWNQGVLRALPVDNYLPEVPAAPPGSTSDHSGQQNVPAESSVHRSLPRFARSDSALSAARSDRVRYIAGYFSDRRALLAYKRSQNARS